MTHFHKLYFNMDSEIMDSDCRRALFSDLIEKVQHHGSTGRMKLSINMVLPNHIPP